MAQAQMALTPFSLNMYRLLMNPGPLVATTKAEGSGNTLASLPTVGKLWPAHRKGFGRGPARREERSRFSTKDSSRDPSPGPAVFLGTRSARWAAFSQGFPSTVSPRSWENCLWSPQPPPQGNEDSQEFQIPFTEALSRLRFLGRR